MLLVTRMPAHSEGRIMLGPHLPAPSLYFPRPFMAGGLQTTMEKTAAWHMEMSNQCMASKILAAQSCPFKGKGFEFSKATMCEV